jgi:hypothetical protein
VLISDYRVWTETGKGEEWIRTSVVPCIGANFCNECFQEPKYEVRINKFKKTRTKLRENWWILLQFSLQVVAFITNSVFLFEVFKFKNV